MKRYVLFFIIFKGETKNLLWPNSDDVSLKQNIHCYSKFLCRTNIPIYFVFLLIQNYININKAHEYVMYFHNKWHLLESTTVSKYTIHTLANIMKLPCFNQVICIWIFLNSSKCGNNVLCLKLYTVCTDRLLWHIELACGKKMEMKPSSKKHFLMTNNQFMGINKLSKICKTLPSLTKVTVTFFEYLQ